MGAVCPSCGDEVSNTYDCRDCGDAFCVDCRLPADHDCVAGAEADGGTETVGGMPDLSLSIPSGPRITVFVPVWRVLPWWAYVVLAVALVPVSTFVLALQVYHERVTAGEYEWRPNRMYYLPAIIFLVVLMMTRPSFPGINTHWVVVAGFGYLWGLPATIIYAVQRRGR